MKNSHQPKEYVQLKGQIERVTFTSEESGYSVVKVKVYGRKELVAVIGNIVNLYPVQSCK